MYVIITMHRAGHGVMVKPRVAVSFRPAQASKVGWGGARAQAGSNPGMQYQNSQMALMCYVVQVGI